MDDGKSIVICELVLRLLDGTISDEQLSQLDGRLQDDPEALQLYCNLMINHAALRPHGRTSIRLENLGLASEECSEGLLEALAELGNTRSAIGRQESLEVDEKWLRKTLEYDAQVAAKRADEEARRLAEARREKIRSAAEESLGRFQTEERRRQEELAYKRYRTKRRQLIIGTGSLAALLLVVVFALLLKLQPEAPILTAPVAPPVVATVTKASDVRWDRPDTPPTPGTELIPGLIRVEIGFLEITFNSEARVIIEAPAEMDVVDKDMARLSSGVLTVYVPERAKGFVVETPSVRVTDMGTEFALLVDQAGSADVHVLDGWVATSLAGTQHDEQQRVRAIYKGDAMRFDSAAGTISPIRMDKDRFARSWDDVLYRPHTSGTIMFERSMPDSVRPDSFESDSAVRLFLETLDIAPPNEMTVGITEPGTYRAFEELSGTLPAGSRVDSYLIHWDPASNYGIAKTVSGSVSFRRPILGLIVNAQRLVASDKLFGHPGMSYPAEDDGIGRRLESRPSTTSDIVVLSQDRLTLHVTLHASDMDQIRILVMSASADER